MVVQVLRPLCAGPVCHHDSSMTCGSRASHDTESIRTYLGRAVIDKGACVCMLHVHVMVGDSMLSGGM